jgi:ABC-type transport system substrate-binding protein
MNMKKRILAMLLAGTLTLGLAACSGSNDSSATSASPSSSTEPAQTSQETEPEFEGVKEIVVGVGADIKTWEPWGAFNLARQNEAPLVYQNLTTDVVDLENGTMVHYFILAESTEKVGDLTYRIKLREGIKDSAGNAFTADDAIFSFQKCAEISTLTQVKIITDLQKVDDLTFDMTLKYDTVGTFYDVCNAINMVTQASYEASADGMATDPVGTGPMVLTDYVAGSSATFEKADSYWNEAANESKNVDDGYCTMWDFTNIDKVRYECITDTATMAIALESGQIDIARAIGMDDLMLFENNDSYTEFGAPDAALGVGFNAASSSPTSNLNLRLALAYAINSESALYAAVDGNGSVAKAWSYPTFVDYQTAWDSQDYFEYNLDTAKEYLAKWEQETGNKASDLKLRLILQNEDDANAVALSIQSDIGTLTGNPTCVEIIPYDRATFTQSKKDASTYDMLIVDSQLVTRSHSGYEWDNLVNQDKNGYNIFHTDDATLQEKLMDAVQVSTTSDATVTAFQDYINEQCYMKNLIYADGYGAAASWIGNLDKATGAKSCLNLGALTYDWNASGK